MEKLLLGVARKIITPEIGGQLYGYSPNTRSNAVEDELTVTAFYFKQGNIQALMISATVCSINTQLDADIRRLIEEKFSIPASACMLSATHTHSGPNTSGGSGWGDIDKKYCEEIFVPSILAAVGEAMKSPRPVRMGTASVDSLVGVNRRELTEQNEIDFGQNPWGPFNPQMTVIAFRDDQDETVANMIHYGAHGTSAGPNPEISRDWSGIMTDALEKKSGAITAFFNGPEGDVGPRISNGDTLGRRGTGDISYVYELGGVAALDAVKGYNKIYSFTEVDLKVSEKELSIPLKKRVSRAEAKKLREFYKEETVNMGAMIKTRMDEVLQSYEDGYMDKEVCKVSQTLIALGNIVFAAFPYELFSEIGMRIDKCFKTKSVLSLSNTNGSEGYFITQDAVCRGGYEVNMFLYKHIQPFCDDADYCLMKETVEHIKAMENREEN